MQCRRNSGSSTTANLGQVPREDSGRPLAAWPADNCFAAAVTSINSPETGGAGGLGGTPRLPRQRMPLCPHLEESEGILAQVVDAYPGVRSPSKPLFRVAFALHGGKFSILYNNVIG